MTSHYLRKIRALLAAQLEQIDDIMRKEDAHPPRCVHCHRVIKDGEDIVPAFEPQWGAAHAICVPHVPIQPETPPPPRVLVVDPRPSLNDVLDRIGAFLNDSRLHQHDTSMLALVTSWHDDLRAALQRQDEYTMSVRQSERQYYESHLCDVIDELDRFLCGGDRPAERDLPLHDRVRRWRRLLTAIAVRTI